MRTSFFFVLWILIYPLIYAFGPLWMQEHAFITALIAVFGIDYICKKLFSGVLERTSIREQYSFYEMIRDNDYQPFLAFTRRKFIFELATSVYLITATVCLAVFHIGIIMIIFFGFLAFASIRSTIGHFNLYRIIKAEGTIDIPEEFLGESYTEFLELREGRTLDEILPPMSLSDKVMRVCNYVFSVLAILLGLAVILIDLMLVNWVEPLPFIVDLTYSTLAIIYGVNDFISVYKGYSLK